MKNRTLLVIGCLAVLALIAILRPILRPDPMAMPLREQGPGIGTAAVIESPDHDPLSSEQGSLESIDQNSGRVRTSMTTAMGEADNSPLPREGEFTGRILSAAGQPIENARIWLSRGSSQFGISLLRSGRESDESTRTDAEGRFSIKSRLHDTLQLRSRAPGFAQLEQEIPDTTKSELGEFIMHPAALLQGQVLDDRGQPLAEAGIRIQPQGAGELSIVMVGATRGEADVTTDPAGRFLLDELAPGPFMLQIDHPNHPDKKVSGECKQPGPQPDELIVQMAEGGRMSGIVRGYTTAKEDQVNVLAAPAGSDFLGRASGRRTATLTRTGPDTADFEFHGLVPNKTYSVFYERPNNDVFNLETPAGVIAKTGDHGLVIELAASAGLEFRVVNAKTGDPIEGFEVRAGNQNMRRLKDAEGLAMSHFPDGHARFEHMDDMSGVLTLEIRAKGYVRYSQERVVLQPGLVQDLGQIPLQPAPILTVVVTDAMTGEPIQGAWVELRSTSDSGSAADIPGRGFGESLSSARTNPDGRAEVTGLKGRALVLRVRQPGYARFELPPAIYSKQVINVALQKGGTVRVLALTSTGAPAVGSTIRMRGNDKWESEKSSEDGIALFENLAEGRYLFRLDSQSNGSGSMWVSSTGGQEQDQEEQAVQVGLNTTHELTLRAKPQGFLEGRITVHGLPLAGATIRLEPASADGSRNANAMFMNLGKKGIKTDSAGEYKTPLKDVGTYLLVISHGSRAMDAKFEASIGEGRNQRHADLPDTVLRGRVVDSQGDGIAGAQVRPQSRGVSTSSAMMITTSGSGGGIIHVGGPKPTDTTDSDGHFSLHGIEPFVEFKLSVSANGYQPSDITIPQLKPDEVRDQGTVVLEVGSTLTVQITDASGQPGFMGSISLTRIDGEGSRAASFQSGIATLEGMAPGRWSMTTALYAMPQPNSPERPPTPQEDQREIVINEGIDTQVDIQF